MDVRTFRTSDLINHLQAIAAELERRSRADGSVVGYGSDEPEQGPISGPVKHGGGGGP